METIRRQAAHGGSEAITYCTLYQTRRVDVLKKHGKTISAPFSVSLRARPPFHGILNASSPLLGTMSACSPIIGTMLSRPSLVAKKSTASAAYRHHAATSASFSVSRAHLRHLLGTMRTCIESSVRGTGSGCLDWTEGGSRSRGCTPPLQSSPAKKGQNNELSPHRAGSCVCLGGSEAGGSKYGVHYCLARIL